jgi:putative oxidoreductase
VTANVGLLVLRAVLGLILFGHGTQKLFGWWRGPGLQRTAAFFGGSLGFRAAGFWAATAALAETLGGALVAVGLLTPLAAVALAAVMAVASVAVHLPKGLWATDGGAEMTLMYLAAAVALVLTGPGAYSLDHLLGVHVGTRWILAEAVVALVAAAVALATRHAERAPKAASLPTGQPAH